MIRKPISPDVALHKAEDLCARSEQCSQEVMTKLRTWGLGAAESSRIIEQLQQTRYIDDARYARAFVRDKIQFACWGRRKISAALALKRIDRDLIAEALHEEASDLKLYMANLLAALQSKARGMERPLSRDDRDRLVRFAASRGYEPQLIFKAINHMAAGPDPDEDSVVDQ